VIVLDTNIVSELMRTEPDIRVTGWLNGLPRRDVWVTTISIFELRFGIELHTRGERRRRLETSLAGIMRDAFYDRILGFDENAANAAASISARQRAVGRPREVRDTFIAGIVLARRADFATRNVRHFEDLDFRVFNPWVA